MKLGGGGGVGSAGGEIDSASTADPNEDSETGGGTGAGTGAFIDTDALARARTGFDGVPGAGALPANAAVYAAVFLLFLATDLDMTSGCADCFVLDSSSIFASLSLKDCNSAANSSSDGLLDLFGESSKFVDVLASAWAWFVWKAAISTGPDATVSLEIGLNLLGDNDGGPGTVSAAEPEVELKLLSSTPDDCCSTVGGSDCSEAFDFRVPALLLLGNSGGGVGRIGEIGFWAGATSTLQASDFSTASFAEPDACANLLASYVADLT